MNRDERGPWYLITALVIGIGAGLVYAWFLAPVSYVDISPVSLREEHKDQYRALIAAAYGANGDLVRARARLDQLEDPDIVRTLTIQAQRTLVSAGQENISHYLGQLALALSQEPTASQTLELILPVPPASPSPNPDSNDEEPGETPAEQEVDPGVDSDEEDSKDTPAATETPIAGNVSTSHASYTRPAATPPSTSAANSAAPLPTRTPTSTLGAPFVVKKDASIICNPKNRKPLIMVEATDASGKPVPGLQVLVQWVGGEDRFFTGLKTEKGLGYADFTMNPGVSYTVQMADGGQQVRGLTASECRVSGSNETYWGSWHISYEQR
jgi:hypothetical protein